MAAPDTEGSGSPLPTPKRAKVGRVSDAEYWCDKCNRSFDRSDHYARHLNAHEDLRPYRCKVCSKGFNRGDLLARHKQTHERKENGSRTTRASRACQACVHSKAKCTNQKPCQRCVSRGEQCLPSLKELRETNDWNHDTHLSPNKDPETSPIHVDEHDTTHDTTFLASSPGVVVPSQQVPEQEQQQDQHQNQHQPQPQQQQEQQPPHHPNEVMPVVDNPTSMQACAIDPSLAIDPFMSPCVQVGGFSFADGFLLPPATGDLDGGCFELDFDTLQALLHPAADVDSSTVAETTGISYASPASSRFEFFKRSPWLWTPIHVDNAYAGQDSLRVNEKAVDSMLRKNQPHFLCGRFTLTAVDSSCRDRILFMIYNTPHSAVPIHAFPSESYLDRMVQIYFGWQSLDPATWIHAPSFSVSECPTELLATIIGAGASSISIPSVCRMGYALQERSRLSLSASIEKDNSRVRELQTIQAYLLWVSVSLWSGFKRNMEVAETSLSAPVTMLRRYGGFSRALYSQSIYPRPEDDINTLEAKWHRWVKQESLKRTAIFALLTDLRCSMAYLKAPNCSITELSCPLPIVRDIWLAPTAIAWRDAFLAFGLPSNDSPSWSTIAQNPSILDNLPMHYDKAFVSLVLMHGFWSQVWSYQESQRFFRSSGEASVQATTVLWLSCQQEDLSKRIEVVQQALSKHAADASHLQIVAEFCKMALNVSPRELQQFAGRLGEEEAATTHHILREWMAGPQFKTAVWHAGQIIRLARETPAAQLREFSAVVLYQASLTLWAYGLYSISMSRLTIDQRYAAATSNRMIPPMVGSEPGCQIFLDGPSTPDTTAFVMFGKGEPGITVGSERLFRPLTDIRAVMTAVCDVYRENFSPEIETFPPLLEGMMNLMTDLGNIDTTSF